MSAIVFQLQSTIIVLLLLLGIYYRKKRKTHVRIMSLVIGWDLLLILQIELSRHAIEKASEAMTATPGILVVHICFALSTVLLYFAMIYTGRRLLKGQIEIKSLHQLLGWSTLIMRLLTYATSFFAVNNI